MFRYIGNKAKLISPILERIHALTGGSGRIADVMAGTGSVSVALRKAGYQVFASDIMTYSFHHLVVALLIHDTPSFRGLRALIEWDEKDPYDAVLRHLNGITPEKGFFFEEYSVDGGPSNGSPPRKYFSSDNAMKIDSIRREILHWSLEHALTVEEESLLKHTLILAANDVANISGTYGYFLATYAKNALDPLVLKKVPIVFENPNGHSVQQGFAEDLSRELKADLCYIDPPYMKRQYAANYHILETLAVGDTPQLEGKSGLRNWWPQHSRLCTKTKGIDSLTSIIRQMDCPCFLISYSEDGLFSLDELVSNFAPFGKTTVQTIRHNRFRSNGSPLPQQLTEYLITIER